MKLDQIPIVFRPGKFVISEDFLVGRGEIVKQVRHHIVNGGQSPIITGARGIGKTSLAYVAAKSFKKLIETRFNASSTFSSWALNLLSKLNYPVTVLETAIERSVGSKAGAKILLDASLEVARKESEKRAGIASTVITPEQLLSVLLDLDPSAVILVDEFDRIRADESHSVSQFGDFLKELNERADAHQIRLVVMGVASTADKLLRGHKSALRNSVPIPLFSITEQAIAEFLTEAEKAIGCRFQDEVIEALKKHTMGFPHYLHSVGSYAVTFSKKSGFITIQDYDEAVDRVLSEMTGRHTEWEFVMKRMPFETAALLKLVVDNAKAGLDWRKAHSDLIELKIPAHKITDALSSLKAYDLIRFISRSTIKLKEPQMLPFLAANFRRSGFKASLQSELDLYPATGPLCDESAIEDDVW